MIFLLILQVQSGFYKYVAAPLFEEWNRFLSSPLSNQMLNNLTSNQARWDLVIQRETARSASMAESVASQISSSSSSGGGSLVGGGTSSRRESMDPHISHQRLSRQVMHILHNVKMLKKLYFYDVAYNFLNFPFDV